MHFQFPEAWYLLPLVVIPFLVNLQRYFNRQTVLVPSLFFLEKVLRKSHRREVRLWELLAELFFLLGLIFLLSRPVFFQPQLGHNNLLVLLDDSPSMQYHFISPQNNFFQGLAKMLEEKRYQKIDIIPISQLGDRDSHTFRTAESIEKFYRLLPPYLNRSWSVEKVKSFFRSPEEQSRYQDYDFIVYSDNKDNHFLETSSEILEFPALLNTTTLPPTPVLHKVELQQENFFTRENMEMTISISPREEENLFAIVILDGEIVFRKQIFTKSKADEIVNLTVKFPVVTSKIEPGDSVRELTIGLEKDGVIFQKQIHVIYVYGPKTVALVPPQHPSSQFFQTLFAYDLEKGNLILSPTVENTDVILVLNSAVNPQSIPLYKNRKYNVLFFIDPSQSTVQVNQLLQKWGVTSFTVDRKRITSALDISEFSFHKQPQSIIAVDLNIKNYFDFSFFQPPDYIIASIQKRPIIFRSENYAVFNGVAVESMIREIDPRYLFWVYELLFSFWGKKPVHYVYSQEAEYSNRISPISQSVAKATDEQGLDNLDSRVITLFTPPVEEFTSSSMDPKKRGWSQIVKSVNTFPVGDGDQSLGNFSLTSTERDKEEDWNWEWVSFIVVMEILLLGLLVYATVIRWRSISSSQKI